LKGDVDFKVAVEGKHDDLGEGFEEFSEKADLVA
jgi:hypothetical protein